MSQQPLKNLHRRPDGQQPLLPLKPDATAPKLLQPPAERRPETFQDLVDLAINRPHRSEQHRRVTLAQLRTMAWILATKQARAAGHLTSVPRHKVVLASIPCDPAWINDHLPHYSRGVFGMTRQSFGNALESCRRELATAGRIKPPARPRLPEDSAWGRLFAALDEAHLLEKRKTRRETSRNQNGPHEAA